MKKRKISLIIIALAMALCMALCIILPACSGGGDDGDETPPVSTTEPEDDDGKEAHTHVYDILNCDDESHWYECSCGEKDESTMTAHTAAEGYETDETSHWQVCSVCKHVMNEKAHATTSNEYKSDETSHWQVCDTCGEPFGTTAHTSSTYSTNTDAHWHVCEVCGEAYGSTSHSEGTSYAYDETNHWKACEECGTVMGTTQAHTPSEGYSYDKNTHWQVCSVCDAELNETAHDVNGENGACSTCGYVQPEITPTTIYMVGDSTMCSFTDKIYIPRYGYGTQLGNYLTSDVDEETGEPYVTVVNLAMSGRSSQTFLAEANYTTLTNSLSEGDYLIIGFGHNDEKSGDTFTSANLGLNGSTNDTISFQDSLKNNYIDLATEKGATPILCTPIVRYSSSGDYSGERAHITSDGDYPQAIRNLGTATGTTVIDLTATTKDDYTNNPNDVVWYHSYNSAKATEDTSDPMARTIETTDSTTENPKTQTVVPSGMDSTHLNMYGAKMVSYEFVTELAKTNNDLAGYIADNIEKPTMEKDFTEEVYNSDYKYRAYSAFDSSEYSSSYWTTFPSDDGLYGTVFGDIGGASKFSNFTVKYESGTYTIGTTTNSGKVNTSGGDGLGMAFKQVSVDDNFTATANVKVTQMGDSSVLSGQTGFGMMMRDDIYIDEYDTTITSTYVTASVIGNGSSLHANAYKVDASGNNGQSLSGSYAVDSEYTVKIQRENQTVYCTLTTSSGTTVSSTATDYNFYEIDENYIYLCLFATRGVICEFTNFSYTYDGVAVGA